MVKIYEIYLRGIRCGNAEAVVVIGLTATIVANVFCDFLAKKYSSVFE